MHIDYKYLYYEKVSSTNEVAVELMMHKKASHGTVVLAGNQIAGKGQRNNTWYSDPLMNLTMSVILKPGFIRPEQQFYISKIISLALSSSLKKFSSNLSIKWPNDIYCGSDKIAGILIEHSIIGNNISHSICGIGLNINQTVFPESLPNPVSIKAITGRETNIQEIQDSILSNLSSLYSTLEKGNTNEIDNAYSEQLYLQGKESEFRSSDRKFYGKICGVNNSGQLIIRDRKGLEKIFSFKEIEFI